MSAPSVLTGAEPAAPVAAGGRRDLARSGAVSSRVPSSPPRAGSR
ncbi:hypothetical protein [Nocardioides zeae]